MVKINTRGFFEQVEYFKAKVFQGDSNGNKLVIISSAVVAIGALAGLYLRKQDVKVDECSTLTHTTEDSLSSEEVRDGVLTWVEQVIRDERLKKGPKNGDFSVGAINGILWEVLGIEGFNPVIKCQEGSTDVRESEDSLIAELSGALESRSEVADGGTVVEYDRCSLASSAPGTPESAYAMDSFQGHVEPEPLSEED